MIAESGRDGPPPLFSVCVPQYNRTSFFRAAIRTFAAQTLRDFEFCVSDGASTDGREAEVVAELRAAGVPFVFSRSPVNLRYDANTRRAVGLARGRYCLLMGNDDGLAGPDALAGLAADLAARGPAGVVVTNFADAATGTPSRRVLATRNLGAGPLVAARAFRNFSFVSGLLFDRAHAQRLATDRWDGSEMYQMFVGCRMIAEGANLLALDRVLVHKDLPVPGEQVDSYAKWPKVWPCPIVERPLPLNDHGRVVADAIAPSCDRATRRKVNELIFRQIYQYTLPFWLVEYRRVQSWRYAAGVALGMRPGRITRGVDLPGTHRFRVVWAYRLATLGGLLVPARLFGRLRGVLYRIAKR